MTKSLKIPFYLVCMITFLVFIYQAINFKYNHTGNNLQVGALIPNIVHYVLFNNSTINFIMYLSMLSVIKVQKPSVIYLHTNKQNFTGGYWYKLQRFSSKNKVEIQISFLMQPTHVYGQRLSSIYHASDISRIFVLRKYGGIYLDVDVVLINNVNKLRTYECVIGWPKNDYIGSQFIMAKTNSHFLKLWQEGYKKYRPRDWYYNAGRYPTELLQRNPGLAHVEPEYFGVQYLLDKLLSTDKWQEWKRYYGIHLLYRHNETFIALNETSVRELPTNFGDIATWILELN